MTRHSGPRRDVRDVGATRAARAARATPLAAALLLAATAATAATAGAQGALAGYGTATVGPLFEAVRFGDGVAQPGLTSDGGVVVTRARQWSVPFAATYPLSRAWTLDVAGAHASGEVELRAADPALGVARYRLAGTTDVRLRATGRLAGDAVLLTLGTSLPTGRTSLGRGELSALRVLAAPALGFQMPGVGVGRSGTVGVVLARQLGGWAWAAGGSYELRGTYNPVQAFAAGIADPDFDPGDAVHLSLGTEGLVGQHAMTLSVSADLFTEDALRPAGEGTTIAATRLGPVYTAEWQLRLGTRRFREATLYVLDRYRTAYEQDGARVAGSDGNYLDAGLRLVRPLGGRTDLLAGLFARHQTGLDVDDALATAATAAGGLTLGLSRAVGPVLVQPYVRGQVGRLTAGERSTALAGFGGGLAIGGRF